MKTLLKLSLAAAVVMTAAPVAPLAAPAVAATHHYYSHTRYRHKVCRGPLQ